MVIKQVDDPTSADDDYDPKSKDFKLSVLEKSIIAVGSLIVVLIMVMANHPEFYKRSSRFDTGILATVVSAVTQEKVLLIKGWAGVNETRNFAIANEKKSVGSYKYDISGLTLSTIGIGTY